MAGTRQDTRSRAAARLVDVTDGRRRRSGEPGGTPPGRASVVSDAVDPHGSTGVPGTDRGDDRPEDEVWRVEELFDDDGSDDGGKRLRIGSLALRPGHLLVLGGALLLTVLVVLGWLLTSRSDVDEVPQRAAQQTPAPVAEGTPDPSAGGPSTPVPDEAGGTASSPPSVLYVHVAGKVAEPGVVELPTGARVSDAIEAAGGARAGVDLRTVNLARLLVDGEQVLVGLPASEGAVDAPPAEGSGAGPTDSTEEVVDLNAATLEQLETLPGVGPVLAQRILETREEKGGYGSVEELNDVQGIGEKRYAELKDKVRVS